jgi:RHH-type proline utilization regulon transcriptional repressor/proline dehydrogenase/delta 1-pyrroline-5-carboxylate dehydrogenase
MKSSFFTKEPGNEKGIVKEILPLTKFRKAEQQLIIANSKKFIEKIRAGKDFSMEEFFHRFNLSEDEGVAILGLAEGLLRIPDNMVSSELVRDKLSDKNWENFLFKRAKSFNRAQRKSR